MNRIQRFFSLILLSVFATHMHAKHIVSKIDSPLVHAIDGIPGIMDAATIKDCYDTWTFIHSVQYKTEHGIMFQGKAACLKDLVIFEIKANKAGMDHSSPEWKDFEAAKTAFVTYFRKETIEKKGKVENSSAREQTKKIVDLWLSNQKDSHATTSLLKNWGTPQEETALFEASAEQLFRFMNDLCHFLQDFMYSCPKARADFEKYLTPQDREAFEKFFTN